jgi:hypothetical protein
MRLKLAKTGKYRKMSVVGEGGQRRRRIWTRRSEDHGSGQNPTVDETLSRPETFPGPQKTQAQRSRSSTDRGSNGKARVGAARQAVESSTKEAGHAVSKAAGKAKTPLLASGAALAGAAGGLAIGTMRSRRSRCQAYFRQGDGILAR